MFLCSHCFEIIVQNVQHINTNNEESGVRLYLHFIWYCENSQRTDEEREFDTIEDLFYCLKSFLYKHQNQLNSLNIRIDASDVPERTNSTHHGYGGKIDINNPVIKTDIYTTVTKKDQQKFWNLVFSGLSGC